MKTKTKTKVKAKVKTKAKVRELGRACFTACKNAKKHLLLVNQVLVKQRRRSAEQSRPPAKPQLKPASTKTTAVRKLWFPFLSNLAKIKKLKYFHLDE